MFQNTKNKWYDWQKTKGNRTPNCWGYDDLLYYWRPSACLLWLKWLGSIILKMINASIIIYLFLFYSIYLCVLLAGWRWDRHIYTGRIIKTVLTRYVKTMRRRCKRRLLPGWALKKLEDRCKHKKTSTITTKTAIIEVQIYKQKNWNKSN